jgi:hypothetical protein
MEINIEKAVQVVADRAIQELRDNGVFISRWIPVSEGLPEVGSEVLVCFDFKGKRSVYISNFYGDGEFHGLDDEYLTPNGRKYRKAVAWMPLPEPYKAEREVSFQKVSGDIHIMEVISQPKPQKEGTENTGDIHHHQ